MLLRWNDATFRLLCPALLAAACASPPTTVGGRGSFAGGSAETEVCTTPNATERCTCFGGSPGRRVCSAGFWQQCECSIVVPGVVPGAVTPNAAGASAPVTQPVNANAGNDRSDIKFPWTRTTPDQLSCEAGHYEGSFAGLYYSRLNWPAPFPVTGVDLPGLPGLQFDMKPARPGETTLEVNGKFDGLADLVFPFRGDFVGTLDCKAGKFTGMMLNGDYAIGPRELIIIENPIHFAFEGPVTADYDKVTHTFVNGTWDAAEPVFGGMPSVDLPRNPLRDGIGGSGVWSAGWIGTPVDYTCPPTTADGWPMSCEPGPFGLNKPFCVYPSLLPGFRADAPACETDVECDAHFPGEHVKCTDINGDGVVVRCLKECTP